MRGGNVSLTRDDVDDENVYLRRDVDDDDVNVYPTRDGDDDDDDDDKKPKTVFVLARDGSRFLSRLPPASLRFFVLIGPLP